jgi:ergothioneine biosynthesis protein EgtB
MADERRGGAVTRAELAGAFQRVRAVTEALSAPLSPEDQVLQSMPACSPTKWHRAHTTWFFETFLLQPLGVAPHRAEWGPLFNSYYVAVGPRAARPKRGMLSRPTVAEIAEYRRQIDQRVTTLLHECTDDVLRHVTPTVLLGLAHEEQHQELLLTDILNAFHDNPLRPAYMARSSLPLSPVPSSLSSEGSKPHAASRRGTESHTFRGFDAQLFELGAPPGDGFRFDNEEPRHRVFVEAFELGDRLVTVGEWKAFFDAGGYDDPSLWLSEGFDWVKAHGIRAPLYLTHEGKKFIAFGASGLRELTDDEPIAHLSFYEADALARFLGARLPTEAEWELAARTSGRDPAAGNFATQTLAGTAAKDTSAKPAEHALQPLPWDGVPLSQLYGDVWEWTSSSYAPFPGFSPGPGAVGEYNGKFMVNQLVLRGGSCFTPRGHVRASYRNFWHPDTRFQMTGLRLARSHP